MNYQIILKEIHEKQLETFCSVKKFRKNTDLLKNHRGLYWIWTNLSFSDLKDITTTENPKEVPVPKLVKLRENLTNIYRTLNNNNFTIIYNGIGGYGKKYVTSLRDRINQELFCNAKGTGTLNLLNRTIKGKTINDNLAISYIYFDENSSSEINKKLKNPEGAKEIETNWRIEYGIPILTRH